jgi:enoyl-CoA hydratase/carnithine racemase
VAEDSVLYDVSDGVAVVRLNRPDALNAVNAEMTEGLLTAVRRAERDNDVSSVVLLGSGRAFCAGQDLKEPRTAAHLDARVSDAVRDNLLRRFENLPKPVVAGLHGYALGRGLMLALACDVRIAAADAMMSLPETQIGMIPGDGATYRLVRLIGPGRAAHMVLTGEKINAAQAEAWGLVTQVVERDALETIALGLARRMGRNAPLALAFAKTAIGRASGMGGLQEATEYETLINESLQTTADWQEGIAAFREKREPRFQGH